MAEKAQLFLAWDGKCFHPRARFDMRLAERFRQGVPLEADIKERRSLPRHRLYWAVLQAVVDATGKWPNVEILHEALKLHLGYFDMVATLDGELRPRPQSISFAKMDETRFREYFDNAMQAITETVLPGFSVEDLTALGKHRLDGRVAQ